MCIMIVIIDFWIIQIRQILCPLYEKTLILQLIYEILLHTQQPAQKDTEEVR